MAITLIGATVTVAFGGAVLDTTTADTLSGSTSQGMTQLDSRAAMVALGDSETQVVQLGASGDGSYRVEPDAGRITITHLDYDGEGNDTVLYNETLGAVIYVTGKKTIAYQGGGVWLATDSDSQVISPPEFHYQSTTLTLPIIRVTGETSVGGATVSAEIQSTVQTHRIYPNRSSTYPETGEPYTNPIREGNVTVTVHSDYYGAWAEYFRTRTDGEVTVDAAKETVTVKLLAQGTFGDFDMPAEGNSIELFGLGEGHPIDEFSFRLRPDDEDSADFSDLKWSLYADEGSQEIEFHLRAGDENDDPATGDCTERYVKATVYYSDTNGNPYHGWFNDTAFTTECDDLDGDGDNETYLDVNLTGTTPLSMESLSSSQLLHFSASGDTFETSVNFSEHGDVSWEPKEFNTTGGDDDTSINNLTNHYLSLMGPDVELTVQDASGASVSEDSSSGTVDHSGGSSGFITYLHITENEIEVGLES